jgi:hypothetical protein
LHQLFLSGIGKKRFCSKFCAYTNRDTIALHWFLLRINSTNRGCDDPTRDERLYRKSLSAEYPFKIDRKLPIRDFRALSQKPAYSVLSTQNQNRTNLFTLTARNTL